MTLGLYRDRSGKKARALAEELRLERFGSSRKKEAGGGVGAGCVGLWVFYASDR